jgi:predicted nucleic acid-binding protein
MRRVFFPHAADTVYWLANLNDSAIEGVPQSHESFLAGLALYEHRLDKQYSLADCISMNVMRERRVSEVPTNDRHFAQGGFKRLLHRNA